MVTMLYALVHPRRCHRRAVSLPLAREDDLPRVTLLSGRPMSIDVWRWPGRPSAALRSRRIGHSHASRRRPPVRSMGTPRVRGARSAPRLQADASRRPSLASRMGGAQRTRRPRLGWRAALSSSRRSQARGALLEEPFEWYASPPEPESEAE